jgi:hypothetical protein
MRGGGQHRSVEKEVFMADDTKEQEKTEEMCCDGEKTAAQHRAESEDGKCCVDD